MSALKSIHLTPADALNRLQNHSNEFIELFAYRTLVVEYYKPDRIDRQTPHERDEVYVITSGSGTFNYAGQRSTIRPGDLLFVPAGVDHRFENFTDDFATWVFFYGPVGGEK